MKNKLLSKAWASNPRAMVLFCPSCLSALLPRLLPSELSFNTIGSPRTCGPGLLLLYQVTAPGCCVRCTRRRHFCWKVLAKLENPEDEEEWFRVNSGHIQNLWCSALSHITFFCISARTGGGNENTFIPYILLDKKHTAYPFGVSLFSYTEWKNEV